ncbi:MAG: hypothetical protein KAK04_12445, partial [Cyclobacteriaceae bacterium]|nr:hypothetical protein [Cyclobacteriaceae bacterium]
NKLRIYDDPCHGLCPHKPCFFESVGTQTEVHERRKFLNLLTWASPAGWRTGRHNMGDSITIGNSIFRGIFIINLANLHKLIGVL